MDWTMFGVWVGALGFIGTAAGVWITYRSARDASRDAAEADRLLRMLLRALHNSDLAEVKFDSDGRPIGLTIYGSGNITLPAMTLRGEGTVTRPADGPADGAIAGDSASANVRPVDGSAE